MRQRRDVVAPSVFSNKLVVELARVPAAASGSVTLTLPMPERHRTKEVSELYFAADDGRDLPAPPAMLLLAYVADQQEEINSSNKRCFAFLPCIGLDTTFPFRCCPVGETGCKCHAAGSANRCNNPAGQRCTFFGGVCEERSSTRGREDALCESDGLCQAPYLCSHGRCVRSGCSGTLEARAKKGCLCDTSLPARERCERGWLCGETYFSEPRCTVKDDFPDPIAATSCRSAFQHDEIALFSRSDVSIDVATDDLHMSCRAHPDASEIAAGVRCDVASDKCAVCSERGSVAGCKCRLAEPSCDAGMQCYGGDSSSRCLKAGCEWCRCNIDEVNRLGEFDLELSVSCDPGLVCVGEPFVLLATRRCVKDVDDPRIPSSWVKYNDVVRNSDFSSSDDTTVGSGAVSDGDSATIGQQMQMQSADGSSELICDGENVAGTAAGLLKAFEIQKCIGAIDECKDVPEDNVEQSCACVGKARDCFVASSCRLSPSFVSQCEKTCDAQVCSAAGTLELALSATLLGVCAIYY